MLLYYYFLVSSIPSLLAPELVGGTLIQLVSIAELFLVSLRPTHPRSSPQLWAQGALKSYTGFSQRHARAPGSAAASDPQALGPR